MVAGDAEVRRGAQCVAHLGPGDHAGELALLDGSPTTADVVASGALEALLLHDRDFHNVLETCPSVGRRLLISLTSRLRSGA